MAQEGFLRNVVVKWVVIVHTFNHSPWEVDLCELKASLVIEQVPEQLGLHKETLSLKNKEVA